MSTIDKLFNQRKLTGKNLLRLIGMKGYTKNFFAKLTNIPKCELEKLIHGLINDKDTFTTYIQQINKTDIKIKDLLINDYSSSLQTTSDEAICNCVDYFNKLTPSLIIIAICMILDIFIPEVFYTRFIDKVHIFKTIAYTMTLAITTSTIVNWIIVKKCYKNI